MSVYARAIREIIRFKNAFDKIDEPNSRVPRKLVGEMGEYYVLDELKKRGYTANPKGGQAGCDICLADNDARIEVRTSLRKNEGVYPKGIEFYGWRVKNRGQKSDDKFDFLVGVALDHSFKRPKFFIFTHKEAFSVDDTNIGRFKSIQKKIHLFTNLRAMEKAIKTRPEHVTRYEKYINKNQGRFLNKWGKIRAQKTEQED